MEEMNQMEWDALLEGAVNNTLSEQEARRLNALLKADAAKLDDYIRFVDMHASLYQEPLLTEADGCDSMVDFVIPDSKRPSAPSGFWRGLASVSTAAAVAAIAASLWLAMPSAPDRNFERERHIGIITLINGPEGTMVDHFVGEGVKQGVFELQSGTAQLRLDNGVELSMRAPVEFDAHGLDHITLLKGKVTANVPPQAIGFRIDTPDMEVVDLGTEFALRVSDSGSSKLHVVEGEVEARLKKGVGYENLPLLIAKDRMNELGQSPSYLDIYYDPEAYAPPPDKDERIRAIGGMLHSLQEAPSDLRNGRYKHEYMMLFPERLNYALPKDVSVDLSDPGTYRMLDEQLREKYLDRVPEKQRKNEMVVDGSFAQGSVRAGTVVDCYMAHFDAFDQPGKIHRAKGRVRFNNRILGVIVNGKLLNETDSFLGSSDTVYERNKARRTENDMVRISSDRRQLFLDFEVAGFIDQVRILVKADSPAGEFAGLE